MFIELVDALRCTSTHEESWLVASATRMDARHIVDGMLGCPVCAAEYPIANGVADFRRAFGDATPAGLASGGELAMRLAALLDLADARGFAILCGGWGAAAHHLAAIVETPLLVIDPPAGVTGMPGISVIRCDEVLPLAPATARAIALDAGGLERVASAVRTVKPKGRVVADADLSVPDGVSELARDARWWVGEREPESSPLVSLHVRRG